MASFFDQKQEVINLELTKHGRKMLGLGLFQPEYYEFFDDDIIYDLSYCKINEQQNKIKNRIQNESISIKSTNILEDIFGIPLGNSSITNNLPPSWDLNVLNGQITFLQNSSSYGINVFDTRNIEYNISLQENSNNLSNSNFTIDDKVIVLEDDYILIDLKELNMEEEYKNFEIEVSTYDALKGGKQEGIERKLFFLNKQNNIIDGIIFSDEELPSKFNEQTITDNDVSFYLDVLVDDEIDAQLIKKTAKTLQQQLEGTYTSTFEGTAKEDC